MAIKLFAWLVMSFVWFSNSSAMYAALTTLLNHREVIESSELRARMGSLTGQQKGAINHFFKDMREFNGMSHAALLMFTTHSCLTHYNATGGMLTPAVENWIFNTGLGLSLIGFGVYVLTKTWRKQYKQCIDERLTAMVIGPARNIAMKKCIVGTVLMLMGMPIIPQ